MSAEQDDPQQAGPHSIDPEPIDPEERRRRKRAARLLGDLAPETTSDERATGWGEREDDRDAELRRDRPPHHGT